MADETEYPINGDLTIKSPEECIVAYDKWADTYDQDVEKEKYTGPKLLLEICQKHLTDKTKTATILDVACGTGIVGSLLTENGYKNVHGIDGSGKMLERAARLKVYKNLYQEILHPNVQSRTLQMNYFDSVISAGSFAPGLFTADFMNHYYQPCKAGGIIIFGLRKPWVVEFGIDKKVHQLIEERVWSLVEEVDMPHYFQDLPGTFFVLRKC